jgi:demethylmenaquinone methyltransferase / 2-methoxy-6-polyprenyl-1,4-benzoquinol methylase
MAGKAAEGHRLEGPERSAFVRSLFNRIAPRYNLMNRLMTAGLDRQWRRETLRETHLKPSAHLLDLATGTGDIPLLALKAQPDLKIVGADFALPMMFVGKQADAGKRILWCGADALHLPFAESSFDAITSAYLIRNLPPEQVLDGLKEQLRVVRPGCRVACLDTSPPPDTWLKPFILLHLNVIIPTLGRLIANERVAYTYLPRSTQAFKTPEELGELMRMAGFEDIRARRLTPGVMGLVSGRKSEAL